VSREKPNNDGDSGGSKTRDCDTLLRKDQERQGGSEISAEGTAVTGGRARKREEARGIRSDRDVRSDLVGESNLAK